MTDAELDAIERRLDLALQQVPPPWIGFLETRQGTGGNSFVRFGEERDRDDEMSVDLRFGPDHAISPDMRLDAVIDLLVNAPTDLRALLNEVRAHRS